MRLRRPPTERGDSGETLIEALVTIGILGIAVVALLGAILMGVRTSVLHRKQAQAQAELRNWAEQISSEPYTACAKRASFAGPGSLPTGLSGTVTAVEYWDGSGPAPGFGPACGPDPGLQRVTLRITVAAGIHPGFDQDLNVVVRKP